jgi:hypothetical protein
MLFIDYSSAFNIIVTSMLITKLRTLDLNSSLCNWILLYSLFSHDRMARRDSNIIIKFAHVVQIGLHPVFWSKSLIPLSDLALIIEKLTVLLKQTFTIFLGWSTVLNKLGQQSMLANLIF